MLNPLILNICRFLQRKKHQFLQLGSGTPHLQGMFYVLAWLTVKFRDVTLFRHLIKRVPGLASWN